MIIGLQIVALTFSFVMIYFALLHYRRREITSIEITTWVGIWIFAILATVFPDLLQSFSKQFKFARLFDLMIVGGLILVIVMVSKAYISTRKNERKLEELVRKEALKDVKKRN